MEFETFHAKEKFVQPRDPVELQEEQGLGYEENRL